MKKIIVLLLLVGVIMTVVGYSFSQGTDQEKKKKKKQQPETLAFQTNVEGAGLTLEVSLVKGPAHNHPMMAIWIEDTAGNYIQTLYVNQSVATSIYGHGDKSTGAWQPGVLRRPAALPYWGHRRGIQASDGLYIPDPDDPVADAYTGATPPGNFILNTRTDEPVEGKFNVLFEINQSWDWNDYWNNGRFPEDYEYRTSAQPSVVYLVTIDPSDDIGAYTLQPIGHSHYGGADGNLYTDISTLTTALEIINEVKVKFIR